mmetsp:Transcript_12026/g.34652  ORF Transcript_12026/g.34652 Transcript_12026/m.34652 type:complete len:210 (-) Transcript_12026:2850-3479(-)
MLVRSSVAGFAIPSARARSLRSPWPTSYWAGSRAASGPRTRDGHDKRARATPGTTTSLATPSRRGCSHCGRRRTAPGRGWTCARCRPTRRWRPGSCGRSMPTAISCRSSGATCVSPFRAAARRSRAPGSSSSWSRLAPRPPTARCGHGRPPRRASSCSPHLSTTTSWTSRGTRTCGSYATSRAGARNLVLCRSAMLWCLTGLCPAPQLS